MPDRVRGSLEWDTYAFSFGHRLATVRRERGLSQEALAFASGMHRNQVSNLERGVSNRDPGISDPLLSTVYRLARALDVPPSYLLPDIDQTVQARSPEQNSDVEVSRVETELKVRIAELGAS
ncbi:helix-turn-helix transcriptional regulator [Gordonia sp. TBRC 11910]|uniref:Helix-turn-helix transcriptional regulator n=1 Tax=Gordonia asplenii TaxID=2725283 RepID=A0A848KTV5_9ACTN|nr:helix-turn-helix transcriptional regulator [Gordonia asplenii]NMO02354.1 helix-turn-helix transcriptional regulator [Gordonia asplenii]